MILKNMIDNFKVFGLASSKVVTKLTTRAGTYANQSQITQHGDTAITSYTGPENGIWIHSEIKAGLLQVDSNSFSGIDQWDIIPFVAILNDASEGFDGWYIYYPCSYGLGQKTMTNAAFQSLLNERGKVASLDKNYNQFWSPENTYRTVYIIFVKDNNSYGFYLQSVEGDVFSKDAEGNVSHDNIEKIGFQFVSTVSSQAWVIDASDSNIMIASSGNVYDIIKLGNIDKVREDYMITDIDSSLSTTISDVENVTERVDELEPLVDSIEDRVSAIESETISKYVSR